MNKMHYVKSAFIYANPKNNAFDFNLVHDI